MATATIKIFLVHGDPKRLRTAELSNWTGKAAAGPRSEFEGILKREESEKSGVYLLAGIDPQSGKPAIYVGEAERLRDRLKSHLEKDFWNQVDFFVSKDENLTKAHVRYLEGRLIESAHTAGRAIVMNGQSSGARLPESDREDMEIFLEKIHQLLPVLGVELLVPTSTSARERRKEDILICRIKGVEARGYLIPNGFLILKDSEAVSQDRASSDKWPGPRNMRLRLKEDGTLVERGERFVFMKDVEFSSPSSAASVVHGGHANGLLAWKTAKGKTLKEIETE
jgi:hypothetical protein